MKKKTYLLHLAFIALLSLASYTVIKTSGSHPGSTAAPGDQTCAASGCHTDASITYDTNTVNHLSISSSDTSYIPGQTYTLTLQVIESHTQKFGFELVALADSNNTNVGTFGLLEPTRTQILNYVSGTDLRYSVSHKTAGTAATGPGTIQWTMKWTAPASNVGNITFWYTTNCTNNNTFATGDMLFLSSFKIHHKDTVTVTGLQKFSQKKNVSMYFNRDLNSLNLNFESDRAQETELIMFDMNGKLVASKKLQVTIGQQEHKVKLPETLSNGAYIVSLSVSGKASATKILIDK